MNPIFILCFARSGSTLLRILLDTHPDVASPPETHVARVCETVDRTWRQTLLDGGSGALPPDAMRQVRAAAEAPMQAYARRQGKAVWCDKSLDSIWLAPLLARVFPDARFVCLHRNCLDFVMSGLRASSWGFAAYGFERYVRESPGNTVRALVRYWCDHTSALLSFERENPSACVRVRYEDVAGDTEATMERLLASLTLPPDPRLAERAFRRPHDFGSGDHKIPFTSGVSDGSVGTGRRVPAALIEPDLRARMNRLLGSLGYDQVGDDWNVSAGADVRPAGGHVLESVPVVMCDHLPGPRVLVVLEDARQRWSLELDTGVVSECDGRCAHDGRLLTDTRTVRGLLADEINLGDALRNGTVRAQGGASLAARTVLALREAAAAERVPA